MKPCHQTPDRHYGKEIDQMTEKEIKIVENN